MRVNPSISHGPASGATPTGRSSAVNGALWSDDQVSRIAATIHARIAASNAASRLRAPATVRDSNMWQWWNIRKTALRTIVILGASQRTTSVMERAFT